MSLKADLLRVDAWGELRPARVELAETHISWVFLLERDVFKVKKPVELGFLDFRTRELRQAACDAEVRLNARLAPEVYRGVVPVRRARDGRACVGGDGEIVDWAVHMVRLDDAHRADRLLDAGALGVGSIEAITARVAAFHASARADGETARFGTPDAFRTNVEENFAQTRATIGAYLSATDAAAIEAWQRAFLDERGALFEDRIRHGRVRDGHGDLRLEHVYLAPGAPPVIIDCIEFNDRFRYADVCADLSFLSMELESRGRVDLAEHVLASYAREANDFDLYTLAAFYESYRAFVRGKIASLVAADEDAPFDVRERARGEARRFFLLALAATKKPLLGPALVAVGGVIASGKSTIAARLGDEMSAPIVDADRTRKGMLGVEAERPVHEGAWKGAYDPAFTEEVYREVLRRAEVVLASGRPAIVDASFRSRAMRTAARELARRLGVPFLFVECRADAATCKARLAERAKHASVSDGRLEIFDAFAAKWEPATELAADERLALDTSRPLDESVDALRAHLETWPRGLVG